MISRIRSASLKSKLENSTLSKPRPSKEDIISTIDGFSGNAENGNYKKRRSDMIASETTLHKRPNHTEIHNYRLPYGLQQ